VSLDSRLDYGVAAGLNLNMGGWLTAARTVGIDGSVFFLQQQTARFGAFDPSGTGQFVINEPVIGATFRTQLSAPGEASGSALVRARSQLWGADSNALWNLVHESAMNNLRDFMDERTRLQPHGSIFVLFLDGNFEASLLLADQLWDDSLVGYVQAGFVIAVPARDVLAFTDAESSAGIAELRGVVARLFPTGDHLISRNLYRRQSGRWVTFEG
jgi:hypothetical protein